MHLLWVTCIQVHVAVTSTHNRSFLWLMDWIETFVAQEENGKHYSRLWCTGCWVQTKNRIKKTKKESVFSPSHLLASSALFRSLSGRASSQSSIVLISFPLLKKERIHSHTSKWIRVHCFKKYCESARLPARSESSGSHHIAVPSCRLQPHHTDHFFSHVLSGTSRPLQITSPLNQITFSWVMIKRGKLLFFFFFC